MRSELRSHLALVVLFTCACSGPSSPADGGPTQADAASPHDGQIDGGPPARVCQRQADCDDGVYCNGAERCRPGEDGSAADGCAAGESPCTAPLVCDEGSRSCVDSACVGGGDADDDGEPRPGCGGDDCDDGDGRVHHGANEVCPAGDAELDALDEDCDPSTIQSTASGAMDGDADGDGYISKACVNATSDGGENRGDDCDDRHVDTYPGAPELCDGRDNDCDETVDEDAGTVYYADRDRDGYGDTETSMRACASPGASWVTESGDCWDDLVDGADVVHPGADWHTTPFCREGELCGAAGSWQCRALFVVTCGGLPTDTPNWDYNCTGRTETQPRGDGLTCEFFTTFSDCRFAASVTDGFIDPHPSDCGESIEYGTFCSWNTSVGECEWAGTEDRTLGCR